MRENGPAYNQLAHEAIQLVVLQVRRSRVTACFRPLKPIWLMEVEVNKQEMLNPTNHKTGRCARWCALVVLVAVCALTVSVATRYGSPEASGVSANHTVSKDTGPSSGRQRLDLNAAGWTPPVVDSTVLQSPDPHARLVPAQPTVLKLFPESSLYNRPPPSL